MAHYDLEEQEQIESIKAWWRQYGSWVSGVLLVIALSTASWQGWNWYQNKNAASASVLYENLRQAIAQNNPQQVRAVTGELIDKYSNTIFASLGALMSAKFSIEESGETKNARVQLAWVAANGKNELRDIARLRLAGIMLDEKEYDEALRELSQVPTGAFVAAYAELKGDTLVAQGKKEEAKAAYQEAMDALKRQAAENGAGTPNEAAPAPSLATDILRHKLNAVGGEA